jgi:hypothetical protein
LRNVRWNAKQGAFAATCSPPIGSFRTFAQQLAQSLARDLPIIPARRTTYEHE